MLTEVCGYLKNWFNRKADGTDFPKYEGQLSIADNVMTTAYGVEITMQDGQYFRIIGSVFNDGVHQYGKDTLKDEEFTGAVWEMAVPADVILLAQEISDWRKQYEAADSVAMSPFNSESFGGYSYSKSAGASTGNGSSGNVSWQSIFGDRLARYKKL